MRFAAIRKVLFGGLAVLSLTPSVLLAGWSEQLFDHIEHDFGYVPRGAVLKHTFRIVNKLNERVHIASVQPSCPICSAALPEKQWLDPGESAEIVATVQTYGFTGERTVAITVTFDYPTFDQTRLTLKCFSRPDIVLQPGALDFGPVRRGTTVVRPLVVDYAGDPGWTIQKATCPLPWLQADVTKTHDSGQRKTFEIQVKLVAPNTIGLLDTVLQLHTSDRLRPVIDVPVHANIVGTTVLARQRLYLGLAYPGETLSKRTLMRASEPVEVVRIETGEGPFRLSVPEGARTFHTLVVEFTAPDKPGIHTQLFLIHVRTSNNEEEVLPFEATATVVPAPGEQTGG